MHVIGVGMILGIIIGYFAFRFWKDLVIASGVKPSMNLTADQIHAIKWYQESSSYHPMTCNRCPSSPSLDVNKDGLYCRSCNATQRWIPQVVFDVYKEYLLSPVNSGEASPEGSPKTGQGTGVHPTEN